MRTMTRNRRVFYYASLEAVGMSQDTDGNYVEEKFTYSDPVKAQGVFSVTNGEASLQLFGMNERYDKVITMNFEDDFLKVGSILWVDVVPEIDEGTGKTETPYDYIVVKAVKSLNFVSVAIRKVDVS